MGILSNALGRTLRASGIVSALVFAGTIIYCADRLGWVVAIAIGWAPAIVMAIISGVGYAAVTAMLAVKSRWPSFTPAEPPIAAASVAPIGSAANVV